MAAQSAISLKGPIRDLSKDTDQSNLTYGLLRQLWADDNKLLQRLRIDVESEIPLGAGLGSRATVILAALWASKVLAHDVVPERSALIAEGAKLEGSPEMLAASLLGGFVVSSRSARGDFYITQRHEWPAKWKLFIVVPKYRLQTAQSRNVLRQRVPFEEAITAVQRSSLLVSAVANADDGALRESLYDVLHENSRSQLVPELNELRFFLKSEPILGCVLCGAGPSVLVIARDKEHARVKAALEDWCTRQPERRATLLEPEVDKNGMQVI